MKVSKKVNKKLLISTVSHNYAQKTSRNLSKFYRLKNKLGSYDIKIS